MSDDAPDDKRRKGHMYDPAQPLPEHLMPKREPEVKGRLRDVDSAERAQRIRLGAWSLIGAVVGYLFGTMLTLLGLPAWMPLVCALFVGGFMFFGTLWFAERAGSAAASVYFSSGSSTPAVRQYSLADSMIARARFDEAAAELQRAAARHVDDPEPCLRLARLLRDHLQRHDEAVTWFRQAVSRRGCDAATEIAASRELIEIYTHRLRTPRRALPDLARLAAKHPATPAGEWARRELHEIKRALREEEESG
jgi:signal transduction histidine kinase